MHQCVTLKAPFLLCKYFFFNVGPNRSSFILLIQHNSTHSTYNSWYHPHILRQSWHEDLSGLASTSSFLRLPSVHQESELNRSMHWYSIDCLLWGRSELLHQTHMSVVIYCYVWKHQYVFHLVHHPPLTKTFWKCLRRDSNSGPSTPMARELML